ncbi:MAG TPA: VOC family protein [Anaerolineae bacterium]|nr:VOC family protein [Anaerolineae bacterium]
MITGIHHIQLTAPPNSEDLARKFYGELLGLLEIEKPAELKKRGGVWFEVGEQQLHIGIEPDSHAPRKSHPAFSVAGLDAVREQLEIAGYTTKSDELFIGYNRFYVRDPFGNRLEFMEPLEVRGDKVQG